MPRFSVDLPDKLNTWLTEQATESSRTKNGQLVYLLDRLCNSDARRVALLCGYNLSCTAARHYFHMAQPNKNDECNCGKVKW